MTSPSRDLRVKRVYDGPAPGDGFRILVDRLWPRGMTKEAAAVDLWVKEAAPTEGLRKWFGHDPRRWAEFKKRYFHELAANAGPVAAIADEARKGRVTLLFAASDVEHNNAVALQEYLGRRTRPRKAPPRAGQDAPGRARRGER